MRLVPGREVRASDFADAVMLERENRLPPASPESRLVLRSCSPKSTRDTDEGVRRQEPANYYSASSPEPERNDDEQGTSRRRGAAVLAALQDEGDRGDLAAKYLRVFNQWTHRGYERARAECLEHYNVDTGGPGSRANDLEIFLMAAGHPQFPQDRLLFDHVKENPDFCHFLKTMILRSNSADNGWAWDEQREQAKAYYRKLYYGLLHHVGSQRKADEGDDAGGRSTPRMRVHGRSRA